MSQAVRTLIATSPLLFLAAFILVMFAVARGQTDKIASTLAVEAQRLNAISHRVSEMETQLVALETTEIDLSVWQAEEIGEASARVQADLSTIAREADMILRVVTPLPTETVAGVDRLRFRIEAEGSLDRYVAFLVAIEEHDPVLAIDRTQMRRVQERGQGGAMQPLILTQTDIAAPVVSLSTAVDQ